MTLAALLTEGFSWAWLVWAVGGPWQRSSMPARPICCMKAVDLESQRINKSFLYMEELQITKMLFQVLPRMNTSDSHGDSGKHSELFP